MRRMHSRINEILLKSTFRPAAPLNNPIRRKTAPCLTNPNPNP